MATWQMIGWSLALAAGLAALYGLHRLALWLEERGHLYYLHKKPSGGGGAGAFVALQRAIEPQSRHVEQVRHVNHSVEEDEASGRGDPDPSG
jgi:hypothetical protein